MKVILQKDVKDHGKKGQMVEVSDGYARNYLFPHNLAIPATADNLNVMKQQEKARQRKEEQEIAEANEIKKKLESCTVKIPASSGKSGKLFGSVTSKEVSEELKKQYDINIEKNRIVMDPIKTFGTFSVKCKLGHEISSTITVVTIEKEQ